MRAPQFFRTGTGHQVEGRNPWQLQCTHKSASRGTHFDGSSVRFRYGPPGCLPPGLTRPAKLNVSAAFQGFYFRASSHRIAPIAAGYHYGAKLRIAPAGLSPASAAASLAALPPVGPLGRVPHVPRYCWPTPTAHPPSRRTSLPSLGGTLPAILFAPNGRIGSDGPGPLLPRRPRRLLGKEPMSPPRFLGDPCVHALLFDPGGASTPGPFGGVAVAFRTVNYVGSATRAFEALSHGLHASCVRFAVGVAPRPRNTRFRWMASPFRVRTFTCWVA